MQTQNQKTELEVIEEQEKMLFPALSKQQNITYLFNNHYKEGISTKTEFNELKVRLDNLAKTLNQIETKKLHPNIFCYYFENMQGQITSMLSNIKINSEKIAALRYNINTTPMDDKERQSKLNNLITNKIDFAQDIKKIQDALYSALSKFSFEKDITKSNKEER